MEQVSRMSDVDASTGLTGENFTRGHFPHGQQIFNRRLCLQLCSPLEVNDSLSWSVHLLLKPGEESNSFKKRKHMMFELGFIFFRIYLEGIAEF